MKNSSASENSISNTPLFIFGLMSGIWFITTLMMALFSSTKPEVCWDAGIMTSVCYGVISTRNFLENAHFEIMNKDEK